MQCKLILVHFAVIFCVHQSQLAAAAAGAQLSKELATPMCSDVSLEDFIEISEACQMEESLGSGSDCWANLDAVLQLCLDEAAAAGHLDTADRLKRNRNRFLGKRNPMRRDGGVRNNFLGKRQAAGHRSNTINAFLRKQLATEKRNRNRFLGKRMDNDPFELDASSTDKRSRNKFLGKRDDWEDVIKRQRLVVFGNGEEEEDKRSRNRFLGKRDQDVKRSRNKFLGKRGKEDKKRSK